MQWTSSGLPKSSEHHWDLKTTAMVKSNLFHIEPIQEPAMTDLSDTSHLYPSEHLHSGDHTADIEILICQRLLQWWTNVNYSLHPNFSLHEEKKKILFEKSNDIILLLFMGKIFNTESCPASLLIALVSNL